jgi:hypothetical protein
VDVVEGVCARGAKQRSRRQLAACDPSTSRLLRPASSTRHDTPRANPHNTHPHTHTHTHTHTRVHTHTHTRARANAHNTRTTHRDAHTAAQRARTCKRGDQRARQLLAQARALRPHAKRACCRRVCVCVWEVGGRAGARIGAARRCAPHQRPQRHLTCCDEARPHTPGAGRWHQLRQREGQAEACAGRRCCCCRCCRCCCRCCCSRRLRPCAPPWWSSCAPLLAPHERPWLAGASARAAAAGALLRCRH